MSNLPPPAPGYGSPCIKRGYTSKREAKRKMRKAREHGMGSYVYRCLRCNKWHLTKQVPRHQITNERTEP